VFTGWGDLIRLIYEFIELVKRTRKEGRMQDLHSTIEKIKLSKTQEERDELAKKIAAFWAKPN